MIKNRFFIILSVSILFFFLINLKINSNTHKLEIIKETKTIQNRNRTYDRGVDIDQEAQISSEFSWVNPTLYQIK